MGRYAATSHVGALVVVAPRSRNGSGAGYCPGRAASRWALVHGQPARGATFAEGRTDAAGFHVALETRNVAPFLHWLNVRRDRLIRFVDREQGLILPRGNPSRIRNFKDIAKKRLRFVNRQAGSGTRLLIDRIMAEEGLRADALHGYPREEFTHSAVAATVAAGGADAGFGLRAAAAERGLAFVPLINERYYLAVRKAHLGAAGIGMLLHWLRSPAFVRLASGFLGYDPAHAGTVATIDTLGTS